MDERPLASTEMVGIVMIVLLSCVGIGAITFLIWIVAR